MSFETPKSPEEFITPEERNEAIGDFEIYRFQVNQMGGNDSEMPDALRFIKILMSGEPVTKKQLEDMKNTLGNPDDKSSNNGR